MSIIINSRIDNNNIHTVVYTEDEEQKAIMFVNYKKINADGTLEDINNYNNTKNLSNTDLITFIENM